MDLASHKVSTRTSLFMHDRMPGTCSHPCHPSVRLVPLCTNPISRERSLGLAMELIPAGPPKRCSPEFRCSIKTCGRAHGVAFEMSSFYLILSHHLCVLTLPTNKKSTLFLCFIHITGKLEAQRVNLTRSSGSQTIPCMCSQCALALPQQMFSSLFIRGTGHIDWALTSAREHNRIFGSPTVC
jgi:hypothetical protein